MKKLLIFVSVLLISMCSFGQPTFEWVKGLGSWETFGQSIKLDGSGNVYTVGAFRNTGDFDPGAGVYDLTSGGDLDVYISKLDSSGNFVWAKGFGAALEDLGASLFVDEQSSIYVTGFFQGTVDFESGPGVVNLTSNGNRDIFISKFDSLGNLSWARSIGASQNDISKSICVDTLGNVYTTGYYKGTVDFDPGSGVFNLVSAGLNDVFISKLDSAGNFVWAKSMGGIYDDFAYSNAIDQFGDITTVGYYNSPAADFDPGTGVYNLSSGTFDVFISKLDSGGNFVWAKHIGGPSSANFANSVAVDTFGNIYLTGSYSATSDFDPGIPVYNLTESGNYDVFVVKLSVSGNFLWAKSMGGTSGDVGNSIAVDKLGNVYSTGYYDGAGDFDPGSSVYTLPGTGGYHDLFISKLDSLGGFVWAKGIGDWTPLVNGYAITVDSSLNVFTTGVFSAVVDFDPDAGTFNLTASGPNAFIHKMNRLPPLSVSVKESGRFDSFVFYPNPTSNNLTIETIKPTNISIVNLLGQELFNSKIERSQTIDVSFLSNGIYFVKDLQNGGSIKFVKQ